MVFRFAGIAGLNATKDGRAGIGMNKLIIGAILAGALAVAGCGSLAGFGETREITVRTYRVLRIVDGDTFKIRYDGEPTSVRIYGIDAPEMKDPAGLPSRDHLIELIDDREVRLVFCGPRRRDNFGRLLARVFVAGDDGDIEVGPAMIAAGAAGPYKVASRKRAKR